EPVARFVSAFNSRLRKGRPRYDVPWTPIQEAAFRRFPTPNALAEALSAAHADDRRLAGALLDDTLLMAPLSYWLQSTQFLLQGRRDIVAVLLQRDLWADFERLKPVLRLPPGARLPDDPVESHKSSPSCATFMSDRAVRNIAAWYAWDFVLYEAACRLRATL